MEVESSGKRRDTLPLTLRVERDLLGYYERVAQKANRLLIAAGKRGNVTVQQVMLQRLRSLPAYRRFVEKSKTE